MYDEGRSITEIDIWGPETISAMPGAAAWMRGEDAYNDIATLMIESGMHWDYGPYRAAVLAHIDEMEDWEEHGTAYEKWCQEQSNMGDLHEPSLFTEWNQATGESNFIGADNIKKNMKVNQYTPEMLLQRDMLNWCFNFLWNNPHFTSITADYDPEINLQVTDTIELLELVAVGDNHGVAKCHFGAVFVPKSALTHLRYNGGAEVGTIFDGEITFTPANKFPWRLKHNGVTSTDEAMPGDRHDDY